MELNGNLWVYSDQITGGQWEQMKSNFAIDGRTHT